MTAFYWQKSVPGLYHLYRSPKLAGDFQKPVGGVSRSNRPTSGYRVWAAQDGLGMGPYSLPDEPSLSSAKARARVEAAILAATPDAAFIKENFK